jgi:hypothetical protein
MTVLYKTLGSLGPKNYVISMVSLDIVLEFIVLLFKPKCILFGTDCFTVSSKVYFVRYRKLSELS